MIDKRCVIVGTAGHIDHGKTALVHALTGKNTDRLKEEQARGISIDIDFAPLHFPDGTLIGIVDVPGHERFVRNMLAGAAGIDAALLVIDLNEGVKPQTLEHIAILSLLGVKHGVVALTKVDLVDADWLEMARGVIAEALSDTIFHDAPVVVTSTKTGQGVDALKIALHELSERVIGRDTSGAFRLPVDKVYSIPGIGTVVSGTVWRGRVCPGDVLDLVPQRRRVRVRGVQVHGQTVPYAVAGQRAALNLTGLNKEDVYRGMVLASPGTVQETQKVDVHVRVLATHDRPLRHRDRVHLHAGTAEIIGRVLLLETDELAPGQAGLAQVVLEKPTACERGDAYVLRTYSPVATLGGGTVIDAVPTRMHRRKRSSVIEALHARRSQSPLEHVVSLARRGIALSPEGVAGELGLTGVEAEALLGICVENGDLCVLPTAWYHREVIDDGLSALYSALDAAHRKRRFSTWVPRAVVAGALPRWASRDVDWLFEEGIRRGMWMVEGANVRAEGWSVALSAEEQRIYDAVLSAVRGAGLSGVPAYQLAALVPNRDRVALSLLGYAQEQGIAVLAEPEVWVAATEIDQATQAIRRLYSDRGPFTLADARDALATSRKTAVSLLEYLDKCGITARQGDVRRVIR